MSYYTAAMAVFAAISINNSEEQSRAQRQANEQAQARARRAEVKSDEDFNRVNMKQPDVFGILAKNQAAGQNGVGSTNLTGAQGVDPALLTLSRNRLLGA